jgi:choice-of-anchor C domain-containing protein
MRPLRLSATVLSATALLVTATAAVAGPVQASDTAGRDRAASPATAGQLADGSFEAPVVPGTFTEPVAGQSLGPWTVGGDSVDLNSSRQWDAADGQQSLDLNGRAPGSVSQPIATFPLTTYIVTFQLAGNPDAGPALKTGTLQVDGAPVRNFSFDTTGRSRRAMGYVQETATFTTLLDPSVTLTFASTTPGAYGPVIDDVQVRNCLLVVCLNASKG